MEDKFTYDEPMSLNDVRKVLDGRMLDISGMFEYARSRGVKVSDLRMEEKKMLLK